MDKPTKFEDCNFAVIPVGKGRSKEQMVIDRLENKFGRYDETDAYKHGSYYLA